MNRKILLSVIFFSLFSIISCEKNNSDKEVLPKQLTSTNLDSRAYLSPNGIYIAFYTYRNSFIPYIAHSPVELWIMNRDGSNQHAIIEVNEIYEDTSIDYFLWSPASDNIIVFLSAQAIDYRSEIWRITVSENKTKLQSSDFSLGQPSYSPDGTRTAFIFQGPNPSGGSPVERLYSANTNFSDTILIEKGLIGDYDWMYDSEGFVYSLYDRANENYDLWKSTVNGAEKSRISVTPENEKILSCSYDGNYIAYSDYNAVYITPSDIFNTSLILDNARLPKWIPNRNIILLYSHQSKDNIFWTESWIVDIHGNVIRKIAEGGSSEVTFSSAGDYFLYTFEGNIWLDYLS